MKIGKIPQISGYTSVAALERKRRGSLAEVASARGWSIDKLKKIMAEELVKFAREWGPLLAGESEPLIRGGARNIASDLIELAAVLPQEEHEIFIDILKTAAGTHDLLTALHQERVAGLSLRIGSRLNLTPPGLKELATAASLHDIGKLAVPTDLLNKMEPLNREEDDLVKRVHLLFGYHLLDSIDFLRNESKIVGYNHIFDGYQPEGFHRSAMPLEAQILSVSDFYDAMTDPRGYRGGLAFPEKIALEQLSRRDYAAGLLDALVASAAGA